MGPSNILEQSHRPLKHLGTVRTDHPRTVYEARPLSQREYTQHSLHNTFVQHFTLAPVYFLSFAMPQPFHFRKLSDLSEKVAKPYTDARAQVLHSKTCVYHSRFRDSVEWVRDGNCHKLVLKPDTPTSPEVAPKMAVLSLVCAVSSEDFWMTADGGWKGPSAITKTFSAVKPSCTLEAPSIDVLRDDYVTGIGNLRWVQDQVAMHGVSKKQGLLVPASADAAATHIKIKHKLFEVSVFFISKASS